ncbi:MAG: hypothetical protein FWG45_04880 [Oscillospiraceae bacterium]|nr:hypothetical protein [Oscillospiraceae bacterium]
MKTKGIFKRNGLKRAVGLLSALAMVVVVSSSLTATTSARYIGVGVNYDSTTTLNTEAKIRPVVETALAPLATATGHTIAVEGILKGSYLNSKVCPRGNAALCNSSCKALSNCGKAKDDGHHKSSIRLLTAGSTGSPYTLRIVGYKLCWYGEYSGISGHIEVWGAGTMPGTNSIATTHGDDAYDGKHHTIQHELSHNLGAPHCSSVNCAMNVNGNVRYVDKWCSSCKNKMK